MTTVWYAIVSFLKKLFVPPEYTVLEKELLRQISHLESEIFQQRERYEERIDSLYERILPGNQSSSPETPLKVIGSTKPTWPERRRQLELASEERAKRAQDEYWRKKIAEQEKEVEELVSEKGKGSYITAPEVNNDDEASDDAIRDNVGSGFP